LLDSLTVTKLEAIDISIDQMYNFAGNMLTLRSGQGHVLLVMSRRAFESLRTDQIGIMEKHCEIIPLDIPTIETVGGGSVRCMMAEIFLDRRQGRAPA
jgi:hypothetical protein